jgi:hypothetical protein
MTTKTSEPSTTKQSATETEAKQADLLAEIEAKQAALDAEAIKRLDTVEAEHDGVKADLVAREAKLAQERAALAAEYGPKREALHRQRQLAEKTARVDTTKTRHAEAAQPANDAHERVLKAKQECADALAAFWPLELTRVQTGEEHKAAVRQLNEVQPGHPAPTVPAKRLAERKPDATEEALRALTLSSHPDAQNALKRLQEHQGWRPPQYAYVQGQRIQVN